MKEIKLINCNLIALVDDEDFNKVNKYRWYKKISKKHKTIYAIANINKKTTGLHIFLLGIKNNKEIDHKDRNGLNNQRYNLRFLTHSENMRNKKKLSNNTSGYIGVSWDKSLEKYVANIKCNNKQKYLGVYDCKIEAARVYDSVCKFYFKGIAQLNFPDDNTIIPKSIENIKIKVRSKFDVILTNIKTNKIIYEGNRQGACKLLDIALYTLNHRIYQKTKINGILIQKL